MIGSPAQRFCTPEDVAQDRRTLKCAARCALATGAGGGERWHVHKDSRRFWASGQVTVLREETGAALGFVKVLRDRTERLLAPNCCAATEPTSGSCSTAWWKACTRLTATG